MAEPNQPLTAESYGNHETAWCPGCGNFGILKAIKQALAASHLAPHEVLFVSGIGQAAKAPHYFDANLFNGLHGRALPVATGARLGNPDLPVIVESGDGCLYGEGGNHFMAAIRRDIRLTVLAHDNQVYALTKGQASPTSLQGFVTKAQPHGVFATPLNPVLLAVALQAGFVARTFSGLIDHAADMIRQAIAHPGFALVDILQPCVSFNTVNTFKWYKERCTPLPAGYDPTRWDSAMVTAARFDDQIPIGVIYRNDAPPFESHFEHLRGPRAGSREERAKRLAEIVKNWG